MTLDRFHGTEGRREVARDRQDAAPLLRQRASVAEMWPDTLPEGMPAYRPPPTPPPARVLP